MSRCLTGDLRFVTVLRADSGSVLKRIQGLCLQRSWGWATTASARINSWDYNSDFQFWFCLMEYFACHHSPSINSHKERVYSKRENPSSFSVLCVDVALKRGKKTSKESCKGKKEITLPFWRCFNSASTCQLWKRGSLEASGSCHYAASTTYNVP